MNVIEMQNVWKRYNVPYGRESSLKQIFLELFSNNRQPKEFVALENINLEIKKGETVGIIGKNASGKTTLLKLLCGVTYPSEGSIQVLGKITGLLELGAGFQSDLTGKENVYLNGSLLGLTKKDINRCFDSIVEFADIGDFIDAPMRAYSSGMYLRLGFAVAVHAKSDIMLIDEVLTVGDMGFQEKCRRKVTELKKSGTTIILASHNLRMVRQLCDRVILLNQGAIYKEGSSLDVARTYQILMDKAAEVARSREVKVELPKQLLSTKETAERQWRWRERKVEIRDVYFLDGSDNPRGVFKTGEKMTIRMEYFVSQRVKNPVFGLAIYREDGIHITGPNTKFSEFKIDSIKGKGYIDFIIEYLPLLPGTYDVSASAHTYDQTIMYDSFNRFFSFEVIPGRIKEEYGVISISNKWKLTKLEE